MKSIAPPACLVLDCHVAASPCPRYREGSAVYEEEMWHRQLGDGSSMGPAEQRCPAAQEWLQQEVRKVGPAAAAAACTKGCYD
jgi:hypothetical protein